MSCARVPVHILLYFYFIYITAPLPPLTLPTLARRYGKNQWSRIASLLHKKSSKQCKARWFEWLDPSIKKTEWSREEEEKLLHLAKLLPTQWRTIAPIIGRTPAQCLDHYEKLLDQAQSGTTDYDARADPRRLRPGEIDPNPHTKPARPDQIDMDEDEKEMLSEARARLANTQGKKAKRKAREKSLEEARRLASLQKRRELRAAGIDTYSKKKRQRGVDYNAEIPFEKKQPMGFFDPSKDAAPKGKDFRKHAREEADGGARRDKQEEKKRLEDKKRHEAQEKKDMPRAVMQMNKMRDEGPVRKRSKLVMPAPQTTDAELEELVKMGQTAEAAMAASAEGGANLLQDYGATPAQHLSARTPKAPQAEDPLVQEALNIIAYNKTDSVLAGGENTTLKDGGGSFTGMTPAKSAQATPNTVLSTPFRAATVGSTPAHGGSSASGTPLGSTPLRDSLSINTEEDSSLLTPRSQSERMRQITMQESLKQGLAMLPEPSGNFDVVVPELPEDAEAAVEEGFVEDAADLEARSAEEKAQDAAAALKRRSQAVQRGLPIPGGVQPELVYRKDAPDNEEHRADELIKKEMLAVIKYDTSGAATQLASFEDDELAAAKALLSDEVERVRMQMAHADLESQYAPVHEKMQTEVMYRASEKKFGRASNASKADTIKELTTTIESIFASMKREFKKVIKLEKKQKKLTAGYEMRNKKQVVSIKSLFDRVEKAGRELEGREKQRANELKAVPGRKARIEHLVKEQEIREEELQAKYAALVRDRDAAHSRWEAARAVSSTVSSQAQPAAVEA